jgi:hypothetical protein
MARQIEKALKALDHAQNDEPNRSYHLREVGDQLRSLRDYVESLESHNQVLTNQLEIERKS